MFEKLWRSQMYQKQLMDSGILPIADKSHVTVISLEKIEAKPNSIFMRLNVRHISCF